MSRFDLVIFDNDGVLVDSEPLANAVLAEILTGYGLPLTWQHCVERYLGSTLGAGAGAGRGRARPRHPRRLRGALPGHRVPAAGRVGAGPSPGWRKCSTRSTGPGWPTCVASSAIHERIRITLTTAGLIDRFDGRLFSAEDVAAGKPAPDLFLHAAATLGVPPARCAVVEDAPAGVEAADAAGHGRVRLRGPDAPAVCWPVLPAGCSTTWSSCRTC